MTRSCLKFLWNCGASFLCVKLELLFRPSLFFLSPLRISDSVNMFFRPSKLKQGLKFPYVGNKFGTGSFDLDRFKFSLGYGFSYYG